jgi:hypothetical protein
MPFWPIRPSVRPSVPPSGQPACASPFYLSIGGFFIHFAAGGGGGGGLRSIVSAFYDVQIETAAATRKIMMLLDKHSNWICFLSTAFERKRVVFQQSKREPVHDHGSTIVVIFL